MRFVAIGSRIRVYLDDETEPRVDVYDGTYSNGSVALRGFRCKGIFDNVVVSTARAMKRTLRMAALQSGPHWGSLDP